MIIMIAAVAENNALGKNNELVWHLPNDFKRFKALTTGHHIIMGRKTFESFPKPLPNRTHIVITRQKNYNPEGCIIVESMEEAIAICPENESSFIIGGGEIYNLGLSYADKLEITRVHHRFEADTFFPKINTDEWKETESVFNSKDDKHLFDFTYQTFVKK
jgi:dihydrofolate reductase